jgi:hypothetical protein
MGRIAPATPGELLPILQQRFMDRDGDVLLCLAHSDFASFLSRRAEEIPQKTG